MSDVWIDKEDVVLVYNWILFRYEKNKILLFFFGNMNGIIRYYIKWEVI